MKGVATHCCELAEPVTGHSFGPSVQRSTLSCAAGPEWLRQRGAPAAAVNEQPNCSRRDAALVLCGRGASAPRRSRAASA